MSDQLQPYDRQQAHGWAPGALRPHSAYAPVASDRQTNGWVIAIAWLLTVVSFGYLLPWAVAASRGKSNQAAIGLLNFLVGWTVIGWIASLVMACGAHQAVYGGNQLNVLLVQQHDGQPGQISAAPSTAALPPAGWSPAPDGNGEQYWDGQAWTTHRAL